MGERLLGNELRVDEDFFDGPFRIYNSVLGCVFPHLVALAVVITHYEGWYQGPQVRPRRNNNPGNLRASVFQEGVDDGYSQFSSPGRGFFALIFDLLCKCIGRTVTTLTPFSTVSDLITVFAPPVENETEKYIAFVARYIDVELRLLDMLRPSAAVILKTIPMSEQDVESKNGTA